MSLVIASNKIEITHNGSITFTTDDRMVYIHSKVSFSFTLPAIPAGTAIRHINYAVATIPYSANILFGYSLLGQPYTNPNGSFVSSAAFLNKSIIGMRVVTPFVDGTTIYLRDSAYLRKEGGLQLDSFTRSLTIYAGNYDL